MTSVRMCAGLLLVVSLLIAGCTNEPAATAPP